MSLKKENGISKVEIIVVIVLSIAALIVWVQMGTSDGTAEATKIYSEQK